MTISTLSWLCSFEIPEEIELRESDLEEVFVDEKGESKRMELFSNFFSLLSSEFEFSIELSDPEDEALRFSGAFFLIIILVSFLISLKAFESIFMEISSPTVCSLK